MDSFLGAIQSLKLKLKKSISGLGPEKVGTIAFPVDLTSYHH